MYLQILANFSGKEFIIKNLGLRTGVQKRQTNKPIVNSTTQNVYGVMPWFKNYFDFFLFTLCTLTRINTYTFL